MNPKDTSKSREGGLAAGRAAASRVASVVATRVAPQAPKCPICAGTAFEAGPKGRMSPNGQPPRCAGCGSLERHRSYRTVFEALRPLGLSGLKVLQFSDDPTVDPGWFRQHELSVFGGANSLDLQAIDRPSAHYDVIVCNHVLEHVRDDRAALREFHRILSADGWLFLSVPDPLRMERTVEYGRAREDKYGHWRLYGPDIVERFAAAVPDWRVVCATGRDPVSQEPDRCFLLARSTATAQRLTAALAAADIELVPV